MGNEAKMSCRNSLPLFSPFPHLLRVQLTLSQCLLSGRTSTGIKAVASASVAKPQLFLLYDTHQPSTHNTQKTNTRVG